MMLRSISLFCLFIVAKTQNSYYDCDFTPAADVEPLTCCKISKPFDKKNFPDCFPDPAIYVTLPTVTTIATTTNKITDIDEDDFRPYNADITRNNNGYRGNSNGYRGNENGFRGNSNGYRNIDNGYRGNDDAFRGNDNGYRGNGNGYRGNNNGFRGYGSDSRRLNDGGGQNGGRPYGANRDREDDERGAQDEHGSGGEQGHGHGHDGKQKHFGHWIDKHHWGGWHGHHDWHDHGHAHAHGHRHRRQALIQIPAQRSAPNCAIECIFNQTNVLANDIFDRTIALEVYADYYPEIDIDLLTRTVDRCAKQLKNYQRSRLRRGRSQINRVKNSNKPCYNGAGLFAACFNREVYRNCPVNLDKDDDDCISLRTYIDNCAPVRRFRDIGFDYYLDVDADGNIVPQTN